MISKIYYTIWSDVIRQLKLSQKLPTNLHKLYIYIIIGYVSNFLGVSFATFMIIIQYHFFNIIPIFYKINYVLVDNSGIDMMLKFIILYDIPVFILNYFLILHNDRYESFIYKYKFYNGKYFLKWFVILSVFSTIIFIIVALNTINIMKIFIKLISICIHWSVVTNSANQNRRLDLSKRES